MAEFATLITTSQFSQFYFTTLDEGFKLFGDETSTCTSTGWSTELPECRLARCIPKANPRNGAIICETDNRNRLVCHYKCNPGYFMNEGFNPTIKCKSQSCKSTSGNH